jgi:hypothetical protein
MDIEREEFRRLERDAVGRICGCKSCLCCEELARDTAMNKAVDKALKRLDETKDWYVFDPTKDEPVKFREPTEY